MDVYLIKKNTSLFLLIVYSFELKRTVILRRQTYRLSNKRKCHLMAVEMNKRVRRREFTGSSPMENRSERALPGCHTIVSTVTTDALAVVALTRCLLFQQTVFFVLVPMEVPRGRPPLVSLAPK